MSKKLLIIIVSVVLALLLVTLVGYYFILQSNDGGPGSVGEKFKSFFPFGGNDGPGPAIVPGSNEPGAETINFTQKLRQLSQEPVAGAGVIDVAAGAVVRYMEKATGHIYETELFSPNQVRISNTTMPVIYEAIWGNRNDSVVARGLRDDNQTIETTSITIPPVSTTTDRELRGISLPLNISWVSVFDNSIFYIESSFTGSKGYTIRFDGSSRKQIWSSVTSEFLPQYVNARTVALTTKPDSLFPGFLYLVDTNSGSVRTILAKVIGLSTLVSPDVSKVIYLSGSSFGVHNIQSNVQNRITPSTFPEKCVWSKKDTNIFYCSVPGSYISSENLVNWYKGIDLTADDIWKYDLSNNTSEVIARLTDLSGASIDVINPTLSPNEQYMIFVNKKDGTLWSLDLFQ